MNKLKFKKSIYSLLLASVLSTTACSNTVEEGKNHTHKVSVTINDLENDEVKKEIKLTWYEYDKEKEAYKVDFDKMLSEQFNINSDDEYVKKLKNDVYSYLGNDLYILEAIYNEKVNFYITNFKGRYMRINYIRDIDVLHANYTDDDKEYSYSACPNKYFSTSYKNITYDGQYASHTYNDEPHIFLKYNIDSEKYISLSLQGYSFSIRTEKSVAKISELSNEEYNTLKDNLTSYDEADSMKIFFTEHNELLTSYVEEVKEVNPRIYNDLCNKLNNIANEKTYTLNIK